MASESQTTRPSSSRHGTLPVGERASAAADDPLRLRHEAQLAVVLLLVRAVGDQAVEVNIEAEVAAEALYGREHARVQGCDRRQAVLLLHAVPHVLHHRPRKPPGDRGQ
jgi:hypothetical protein